jgi:hypothetical protein
MTKPWEATSAEKFPEVSKKETNSSAPDVQRVMGLDGHKSTDPGCGSHIARCATILSGIKPVQRELQLPLSC